MKETGPDQNSASRKKDHLDLALRSKVLSREIDTRFYYEPMMAAHPSDALNIGLTFLGKELSAPIWVSSMTGGTNLAHKINKNLAIACKEFGLGMGLGSCRSLLYSDEFFEDFNMRKHIGDQPLYANLGIAQIEQLVVGKDIHLIKELLKKLEADGLVIHVNPLQEWLQPEGDKISIRPIELISSVLEHDIPIIVKEVGQGMGYGSLKNLIKLPIRALEFGAHGGTNFSKIEILRNKNNNAKWYEPFSRVGHDATEMVDLVNTILIELGDEARCDQFIISGGITNFLDGYFHIKKCVAKSVYGQASQLLKYAKEDYVLLHEFLEAQIDGLILAFNYLRLK